MELLYQPELQRKLSAWRLNRWPHQHMCQTCFWDPFYCSLVSCQQWFIKIPLSLRKKNHSIRKVLLVICGYSDSSGEGNIAVSGPTECLLDWLKPVKQSPPLWHQYKVASLAKISEQDMWILQSWLQPIQERLIYESCAIFPPCRTIRLEAIFISLPLWLYQRSLQSL